MINTARLIEPAEPMNIRYRKLVGLFILLALLFAYMVVASWIGATYVNELGGLLRVFYYFFTQGFLGEGTSHADSKSAPVLGG